MDILIIMVCLYFAFQNGMSLFEIPFGQWELVQWALLLVSLGLLFVAGLRGRKLYLDYAKKRDDFYKKAEEEANSEGKEGAKPGEGDPGKEADPPTTKPLPPSRYDDDDDLAYLDEMDAEEDALQAKQEQAGKDDES